MEGAEIPLIQEWYLSQKEPVQSAFDQTLAALSMVRRVADWEEYEIGKLLHDRHDGLFEMKFRVGKRKFRPAGFILMHPTDDGEMGEAILIIGCEKSGRIYVPNNAFDTALRLRNSYLNDNKGTIHEHFR